MSKNKPAEPRISPIDMKPDEFRSVGYSLINQIADFLDTVPQKTVTTRKSVQEIKNTLGVKSLPEEGFEISKILNQVANLLFENSLINGHPRFWGYITSSPAPAGMLADLLAAAVNANVGAYSLSPMATEIERQTIQWIASFVGFPDDASGLFVSGGNMANITGLLAARKAKLANIREQGLKDRKVIIYCSAATHTWINKAADLLGFGTNSVRWIETDSDQRMNVARLEEQIKTDRLGGYTPFIVVATAGTVGTGAIDPIKKIALVCEQENLWLHVDGAYGAPAVIVPEVAPLFDGMELADSIAIDPHKWLYSPLEAACLLVRNPSALKDAFSFNPDYYNFSGSPGSDITNYHEEGFQNSRGFRALKVWVTLQQVGKRGYRTMIQEDIELAKMLFEQVGRLNDFEAISRQLSIVAFRYITRDIPAGKDPEEYLNALNKAILNRLQSEGDMFLSNAVVKGKYCLRACIVNFRTDRKDIVRVPEEIARIGNSVQQIAERLW